MLSKAKFKTSCFRKLRIESLEERRLLAADLEVTSKLSPTTGQQDVPIVVAEEPTDLRLRELEESTPPLTHPLDPGPSARIIEYRGIEDLVGLYIVDRGTITASNKEIPRFIEPRLADTKGAIAGNALEQEDAGNEWGHLFAALPLCDQTNILTDEVFDINQVEDAVSCLVQADDLIA